MFSFPLILILSTRLLLTNLGVGLGEGLDDADTETALSSSSEKKGSTLCIALSLDPPPLRTLPPVTRTTCVVSLGQYTGPAKNYPTQVRGVMTRVEIPTGD